MALCAGTCECHLCWKPQTAFLSGSVGVSLPGFRWASEHVMSIWADPPLTAPPLVSALRSAHCQGQWISMHERKSTIFAKRKPNVNGKGHCVHWANTACSVARLKGPFWFFFSKPVWTYWDWKRSLRIRLIPLFTYSAHYLQSRGRKQ